MSVVTKILQVLMNTKELIESRLDFGEDGDNGRIIEWHLNLMADEGLIKYISPYRDDISRGGWISGYKLTWKGHGYIDTQGIK